MEFLGEWGTRGDGPGQLSDPTAIAADSVGNLFLTDAGSRFIHKFNPAGVPLQSFQSLAVSRPVGIALDANDTLYVADERNAILLFAPTGLLLRVLRAGIHNPRAIALDASGSIYLLDEGGRRVLQFDSEGRGRLHCRIDSKQSPAHAGFAGLAIDPQNRLFVLDPTGESGECQTPEGQDGIVLSLGLKEQAGSGPRLAAIAIAESRIFVVNAARKTLDIRTLDGKRQAEFGLTRFLPEGTDFFVGLTVSRHKELFLLCRGTAGARVLRFRVNL